MMTVSPFMGPTVPMATLNLQLNSGSSVALAEVMPLLTAAGASANATSISGLYKVQSPAWDIGALAQQLSANSAVQYANPPQTLQIATVPNDPFFTDGSQWGLNDTWGIDAPTAWNTTTGSNTVIVADVDTGINYNNPDLINNIWLNQAEIPSSVRPNLTDVDGDGLITFADLNNPVNKGPGKITDTNLDGVITGTDLIAPASSGGWSSGSSKDGATLNPDDLIGWSFVPVSNNNPLDLNGHGTHTAGIIGAVGNNAIGVSGVNWNVQIMAVQVFDASGGGSDVACAEAIHYAVDHGAKVINASWGSVGWDPTIAAAIQYADQHSVIIVAAAGNYSSNDTTSPFSPASYSAIYPNVISVASIDSNGALSGFSNFGVGTVQLAAPGNDILSTLGADIGWSSGTSMAAPFVTGTVALVYAAHPTWSMSQVIDAVVDHTAADPALVGKVTSGGVLNAAAAVANTHGAYVVTATPNGEGSAGSPLSSVQLAFNEEIDPATFTPARVTLTGPGGTISGVTVTPVSGSNNHTFLVSFPAQTTTGAYTLKVGPPIKDWYGNSMDQNRNGANGEASDQFVQTIKATSATFLGRDTTTRGNWIGTYGTRGYNVIGNAASYPSYATVSVAGQTATTWAATSTDAGALLTPGGTGRIAAAWYSGTSFTVNVNLTDGQAHDIALYAYDWPAYSRSEQIQLLSAATGAVLDTQTVSNFNGGLYLQWKITGNVIIQFSGMGGKNAVLSGLFFDPTSTSPPPATASLVKQDTTAQGNWIGTYGTQGYSIIGASSAYPSYATVSVAGQTATTWAATTTDPRALQRPGGIGRIAAAWYSVTSFAVDVNLTDGQAHDVAVYALDWPAYSRSEQIQVLSAATGAVLDTQTISNFNGGLYLQWKITGNVIIKISGMGGKNAVLSGLFFDPTPTSPPPATASLVKQDTTTQGNWIGAYGSQGYNVIGASSANPSYATVSVAGQTATTWAATTTDPRALQRPGGTGRIAAAWYSGTSFTVNVNLTDGQAHDVAVYALDWPNYSRSEQIQLLSAATGAVLDTQTISNFNGGLYLQWKITGNVIIKFSGMGGTNAVLSGLFFDPSSASPPPAPASQVGQDTATQGNWSGAYGILVTGPIGTVDFSSTDSQAVLRPDFTGATAVVGAPPRRRPR